MDAVRDEIERTGTYRQTTEELTFGARVAWRNAARCIGRLYWNSLAVLDRREVTGAREIGEHLVGHLRSAHRGGRIRATISVFAPAVPGRPHARVWNDQLVRYAGYRDGERAVGDPRYVEFTDAVRRLGWAGSGGPFDVLPLVVQTPGDGVHLVEVPQDAVAEVTIRHPEHQAITDLGLRWYAVPAISNMRMTIGGVHYPLAPFNGWYMGSEIGARNLVDPDRYDMLPAVAGALGLDTSRESTLWRDRALVELNRAVLWSFEQDGQRISDHHTESARFLTHLDREQQAGRTVPADWSWIVPPLSGGITPVFHRYYAEEDRRPGFYLDPDAAALARTGDVTSPAPAAVPTGQGLCPVDHAGPTGPRPRRGTRPAARSAHGPDRQRHSA